MGRVIEAIRIILVAVGYFVAYSVEPQQVLFWLVALAVIPLTLITALEGQFFMEASLVGRDWGRSGSRYRNQSTLNFFAITITAVIVLVCHMSYQAQLTIILVSYIFFALSSINHLLSYFQDKKSTIQMGRFVSTLALWGGFFPLLVKVWPLL